MRYLWGDYGVQLEKVRRHAIAKCKFEKEIKMGNSLIDPETATAIAEASKTTSKALDLVGRVGNYSATVFGSLPHDLIGLLAADWLHHKRVRRWAELTAKTEELLRNSGFERPFAEMFEDVTPSLAVPLIEAALDETREGLKELWAKLLASAMHPQRQGWVRQSFISILKQMDPNDAFVLQEFNRNWQMNPNSLFGDEERVSIENLMGLRCLSLSPASGVQGNPYLTSTGRLFLRALTE